MSSLFNNPMVDAALKAMSPEQLQEYKRMGEAMYNSVNFEDSKILNNLPPPMAESVAYIEVGLRSGLLPGDMSSDEIALMKEAYGDEWYKRFDFKREDIPGGAIELVRK